MGALMIRGQPKRHRLGAPTMRQQLPDAHTSKRWKSCRCFDAIVEN